MESFSINLNQMAERGGRYKRFLMLIGLSLLVLFIISFVILYLRQHPMEWLFLALAIYAGIFIYFALTGNKAKLFINGDDFALEYQFGFFSKVPNRIIWQTISKVRIGPTYIAFIKRSGKRKAIALGWLPYAKVIEIKDKIHQFAKAKEVDVEVIDYQKG